MNTGLLKKTLKERGLRNTKSRTLVFEVLKKAKVALSTKEIFEELSTNRKVKTDLVSVYRNLDILTEIGLAHKFQDGRYKSCDHDHQSDDQQHDHIHVLFTCSSCSRIEEVSSHSHKLCSLATNLKKHSNLLSQAQEIVVQGICSHCST
jgi:Fe2+ or Zn2+ uptake regulation protein